MGRHLESQVHGDHTRRARQHIVSTTLWSPNRRRQVYSAHIQQIEHIAVRQELRHDREVRMLEHTTDVPHAMAFTLRTFTDSQIHNHTQT